MCPVPRAGYREPLDAPVVPLLRLKATACHESLIDAARHAALMIYMHFPWGHQSSGSRRGSCPLRAGRHWDMHLLRTSGDCGAPAWAQPLSSPPGTGECPDPGHSRTQQVPPATLPGQLLPQPSSSWPGLSACSLCVQSSAGQEPQVALWERTLWGQDKRAGAP